MSKPEYDQWAEALLQEIYYAPDEDHRVAIITEHLLKAVRRGHIDSVHIPHWQTENCLHKYVGLDIMTCSKCGVKL